MKRQTKYLVFTLCIFTSFYIGYMVWFKSPNLNYVREGLWFHKDGFKFDISGSVDFTEESGRYRLSNDTILVYNVPTAIIIKVNKFLQEMTIKSINSGETGKYYNDEILGSRRL